MIPTPTISCLKMDRLRRRIPAAQYSYRKNKGKGAYGTRLSQGLEINR